MLKIFGFMVAVLTVVVWCLPTDNQDIIAPVPTGYCHHSGLHIKERQTASAPIGICKNIECKDAGENRVAMLPCLAFTVAPGCRRSKEDLTKLFPNCCSNQVCGDEE